jgi:urea transport system permease protein
VRLLFGAQNVEVANPAWLSGGIQVLPNLVLYNRIVIIAFALFVVVLTWLLLNKTRLGLNVRAVTQNRNMAACCGVPTGASTCSPSASAPASPGSAAWP